LGSYAAKLKLQLCHDDIIFKDGIEDVYEKKSLFRKVVLKTMTAAKYVKAPRYSDPHYRDRSMK